MNYNDYILLILDSIKEESPEKVILFGSYAYGEPNKESDIDLLVIKDIDPSKIRDYKLKLRLKLCELTKKWNIPVDIIVDNQQRIDQRIKEGDRFYEEILTKGNVLYA